MENNEEMRKKLIRRLHAMRTQYGMTQDEYYSLLDSFGVESSREMTAEQLSEACEMCGVMARGSGASSLAEVQRRRLIAASCRMLEAMLDEWEQMDNGQRMEYAKTVACRAAGVSRRDSRGRDNFNRLTVERMRSLSYAFERRRLDMERTLEMALELMSGKEAEL